MCELVVLSEITTAFLNEDSTAFHGGRGKRLLLLLLTSLTPGADCLTPACLGFLENALNLSG